MTVRVGIDYTAAVHQTAGIGRYTRELVSSLAALSDPSFRPQFCLFVANAGQSFDLPLPGSNFKWAPTRLTERWLARLWYRLRLPLPVQNWTGPLDLFHAPDFILPPVKHGTRTIVTIHDLSFVREPDITMPGMSRHLNKWVPASVRQADRVIAVSKATRHDLIELYRTPPEKISVVYHGVGPEFRPVRELAKLSAVQHKYRLDKQPYLLSVGTLQPRKNYKRLVQAFAKVDRPVSLVIVGTEGWGYEELYREVAALGLTDRVFFTGFVAEADLPALLSAARLFVYPSLYEGFGLPVLEAMACGTPIVASDRSSLPEVVGEAGLLVDPRDVDALASAIIRLLDSPSLAQSLSEAGLAQVTKFDWMTTAVQLLELYQQAMAEPEMAS
jgi:glycosyltransferase involved in cell wall biosynthesis